MKDVDSIARGFREALEKTDLSNAAGALGSFPEGCCAWGVRFIGQFLKYECGLDPQHVVGGRECDGFEEHEWLELGGIIVDITADQYPEGQPAVIVSEDSTWHKQWQNRNVQKIVPISTFDRAAGPGEVKASEVYEEIAEYVRSV